MGKNNEDKPKHKKPVYKPRISIENPRDLIEIICKYDIKHCVFPTNKLLQAQGESEKELAGIALDNIRTVYIDKDLSEDARRLTVIHELIHCHSYIHGLGLNEDEIKGECYRLFEKWYGYGYGRESE